VLSLPRWNSWSWNWLLLKAVINKCTYEYEITHCRILIAPRTGLICKGKLLYNNFAKEQYFRLIDTCDLTSTVLRAEFNTRFSLWHVTRDAWRVTPNIFQPSYPSPPHHSWPSLCFFASQKKRWMEKIFVKDDMRCSGWKKSELRFSTKYTYSPKMQGCFSLAELVPRY
jgi:hypothetical protein